MTRSFQFTAAIASGDGIPDLTGRVAIVTGSNGGIGLETAYYLASHNCTVYIASRSSEKTNNAHAALLTRLLAAKVPNAENLLHILPLSLNSISTANSAAQEFLALNTGRLDILILNAGIAFDVGEKLSPDGFEMQFQVNYLSHLAFTHPLLPLLKKTSQEHGEARIVNVSSDAHLFYNPPAGETLFDIPSIRTAMKPTGKTWGVRDMGGAFQRYGRSKLAGLMAWSHLSSSLEEEYPNLYIVNTHPGTVATTGLGGGGGQFGIPPWVLSTIQKLTNLMFGGIPEVDGALSGVWAGAGKDVAREGIRAGYWVPQVSWWKGRVWGVGEGKVSKYVGDVEEQKKIWEWGVGFVGDYLKEKENEQ